MQSYTLALYSHGPLGKTSFINLVDNVDGIVTTPVLGKFGIKFVDVNTSIGIPMNVDAILVFAKYSDKTRNAQFSLLRKQLYHEFPGTLVFDVVAMCPNIDIAVNDYKFYVNTLQNSGIGAQTTVNDVVRTVIRQINDQ